MVIFGALQIYAKTNGIYKNVGIGAHSSHLSKFIGKGILVSSSKRNLRFHGRLIFNNSPII